jgi:hypothetical protein
VPRSGLEEASFLDDRILRPESEGRWVGFSEVGTLLQGAAPTARLHAIFHSGHVGSTLVSRLLDSLGGVLGLREPLPLRVLAEAFDDSGAPHALLNDRGAQTLLNWCCLLWRRGFPDTEAVVVKATSSAGRISSQLLRTAPDARAVFMNLKPEPYLTTLLAGQNSPIDLRGQGAERHKRLARLGVPPETPLHKMSLGELAALTWLAEALTQTQTQAEHGARILAIDFDAFLAAPAQTMKTIASHFDLKRSEDVLSAIADSPVLQRYSKAPERSFTPALRQEILADSQHRNSAEIRNGLQWLEQISRRWPVVERLLSA